MKTALAGAVLTSCLLHAVSCSARDKVDHYPVTRGSELASSMASSGGNTVAVEVRVTEIARGAYGKPYIRAEFPDGTAPLWIAPVVDVGAEVAVGDVVRAMGYVAEIDGPQAALLRATNPGGYHLLAICYYSFRTKHGLFFPFGKEPNQCTRWRDGASDGR